MLRKDRIKLFVLIAFIAGSSAFFLLTDNRANTVALAYSSGPPAGFTGAPGEFTCSECHVPTDVGTGKLNLSAPQTYVPGQTYQITVAHTNQDQTRQRWGFQLTALDDNDQKAGTLQNADSFTQILNNQGPGSSRQYVEHTSSGTFFGQHNGASWTFNWTAPPTDIGPVTFYVAGNQANGDGNTSGDNIYFTFAEATPATNGAAFTLGATPSAQTVLQGNSATYNLTLTPSGGFTGQISLSVTGLPAGTTAVFNPATVNLNDGSPKTATLTVTTTGSTPIGTTQPMLNAVSGSLTGSASVSLKVTSQTSADLSLAGTVSPNPGSVGANLSFRIVVTNNGPATATNIVMTNKLPGGVTFVSATPTQGTCDPGTLVCNLGGLSSGNSAVVTIVVTPNAVSNVTNSASATASESDPDSSNNSTSVSTHIDPAAVAPSMLDPNLSVKTVINNLDSPTSMAFLGANDFLVLEKNTGKVQRVTNGVVQNTVLDLAVNNASERGLLGIALHPGFATNGYVYLYWTESSTGADSGNLADVPLLGNRVDRYIFDGQTLSFDRNLIKLRAYQADANQPLRGNHNGGVIRFGPDGKLYIIIGDNGRRGFLQNITSGGPVPDDQYGGPDFDDAHLTGVILRLNDDGTTPSDNPFFNVTSGLTGEAAANVKKIYAYGVRNSFGVAFDPFSKNLWTEENGDDSFDEINRVGPGFNGGWTQIIGPVSRIADYKSIETTYGSQNLQQLRWSPSLIADTPEDALARLYNLPGSHYTDPEFSWKYAVAPSPLGFMSGRGLGPQYEGDMFVGASRTTLAGGYLFRFKLSANRQHLSLGDARLADAVADNLDKFDLTESESLLVGRDFGITTDIESGPNGHLFVVSNTNNAVYEISAKPPTLFVANLTGAQVVPPTNSVATGAATLLLNPDEKSARVSLSLRGLTSAETAAHIHGPAATGINGPVLFPLPSGSFSDLEINLTPSLVQSLKAGQLYIDVHSNGFADGEIRGQFNSSATASSLQFSASSYSVQENAGSALISVTRLGDTSGAATVDYTTSDGTATNRTDYIASSGTLTFAAGETSKSFSVLIEDDAYLESSETVNLALSNPTGGAYLGSPGTAILNITDNDASPSISNPLDDARFFVRQQYLDFLNREPDTGGLGYWTNEITKCGTDAACINSRRIGVSAAFFIESEFQETGYFVYRLYKSGLNRQPAYAEFTLDRSRVIAGAQLEASRVALVNDFITRAGFLSEFPQSFTPAQYVDKLNANTGASLTQAERDALVGGLNSGTETRATVLRKVADNALFKQREYNSAFVLMQYFGYLHRDPDSGGYLFWLDVLNNKEPGNFRGMVCSFITSAEYQERFSSIITRTNRDCAGIH